MKHKVIALLPMKANSERVKGKNFREFCGKPLFRWVLDALLAVEEIGQIVINTDARHILADNGLSEGGRVLIRDRKPEICGDSVSMNLVLADDVAHIESDIYIMTHTTNPLMTTDTVRRALNRFTKARVERDIDSLFSVNRVQERFYRSDCSAINHDPDNLVRTQDLEPWFIENSNIYIFTRDSFAKTGARIGKRPMMFETPKLESIDIDTPDDWDFALAAGSYLISKRA